jgi:hypothetical protein
MQIDDARLFRQQAIAVANTALPAWRAQTGAQVLRRWFER